MTFTISQAAKKVGLTAHTLRYYDKEGLLPFVKRTASGIRFFTDKDLEWLVLLECLKETGMSIHEIKQYIDWFLAGDSTLEKRLELFRRQKKRLEKQIRSFQQYMDKINYKIAFYEEAVKKGSIDAAYHNACLQKEKERVFRKTGFNSNATEKN